MGGACSATRKTVGLHEFSETTLIADGTVLITGGQLPGGDGNPGAEALHFRHRHVRPHQEHERGSQFSQGYPATGRLGFASQAATACGLEPPPPLKSIVPVS